jgi:hypothetical protein
MAAETRSRAGDDLETRVSQASETADRPVPDRTCILVLGMHRSGTSAFAGAFGIMGAALPIDPVEGHGSNPKGHFESQAIVKIHDELLETLHTSYDDWRRIDPAWFESTLIDEYRFRLAHCVKIISRTACSC